jgi:hypothetical protein
MKLFELLDKMHKLYEVKMEKIPTQKIDIKEYKKMYYLHNFEIYKERNKNYRYNKKYNVI